MTKVKGIRLGMSLLIMLTLLIPVGITQAQDGPAEDHAGGPSKRVELTLRADGAPVLGGSAILTMEAIPLIDAPEMQIHWMIPQGVEMIGEDVDTFTFVTANNPAYSARTLRFTAAGTYKIAVSVNLVMAPEETFGTSGVLFFVIDHTGSYVTDKDPDAERPVRQARPGEVTITSTPAGTASASPEDDPCFTIGVHVDRIERTVTPTGYGEEYRIPLTNVAIEFRESDLVFDDSYGTLATDANGNVVGAFCDDDGLFNDELEIYLRITAEKGDPIVYVEDSSYIDEKYEYDTDEQSSSGGVLSFNINLGYDWSGIFNIIDAAWQARQVWLDNGGDYDHEVEIHWEPGYGDETSYYDPTYEEITIADDPSDPDQWDESIIIHEWGHSADDYYSCDENPGGDHAPGRNIDPELAWHEGYPSYYQSVVRDAYGYPYASYVIDINGAGQPGNVYNIENKSYPISTQNQGSISAALWDLYDDVYDSQDRVSYPHSHMQAVFTSEEFYDIAYGTFDDTCDFDTYMRGWVDYGFPTDRDTAAAVQDNTGYTLPPSMHIAGEPEANSTDTDFTPAEVYRWWKQLTYVGDNSSSMSGPKFNAMKDLFVEAVNDLGDDTEGTEFTLELFNNTTTTNDIAFAGQFYPEDLIDPINGLTTIPNADPDCEVYALHALAQAVDDKEKGDVWLFTDRDTHQSPPVEVMRQLLNAKEQRASMALMGICAKEKEGSGRQEPFSTEMLEGLTPEQQQALMAERLLAGQAREELGLMADEVPGGIVPYMLTALNSGGQFLYVDESQVEDAADILRAQITNSAGAGRWSDYVSDQATYRYDELASWEYQWIDATLGEDHGNPPQNWFLELFPPSPYFEYYHGGPYSIVRVFEEGYTTFGNHIHYEYTNTTLPNPDLPNLALYPFWDNLKPYCPPGAESTDACVGKIYVIQQDDWYVIEYYQYDYQVADPPVLNTFEIMLNLATGEIRYQYLTVPNGAESATIGLENSDGSDGVMISYNDVGGAEDGMGYKFTPAPPQPTKTYTVAVDSTMESVGFLLTGYSGSFEPLEVRDPDGHLVSCTEPGALCLDLDLVQYVQVNTDGRVGDWTALVDAGPTGSGTFSFTSFATSPIAVEGQEDHNLKSGIQQILVELSGQIDGCQVTGLFRKLDGSPFGHAFTLFDDGQHGDGADCDGLFGSSTLYLSRGSAYLTISGAFNGELFRRIDPRPYSFQPLEMESQGDGANYGNVTELEFQVTNHDIHDHCYWIRYDAPEGWWIDFGFLPIICVDAGHNPIITFDVYMTEGTSNYLPSGTTGVITISAIEVEKGEISDSASARITRHRQPYRIEIFNPTHYLRPNGDQAVLEFLVTDLQGVTVADGTTIQLITNNGDIDPVFAETTKGYFTATFTSGQYLGTALIMAQTGNGVTAETEIEIINPLPDQISLWVSDNQLPADGVSTATLVATVRDQWGDPVANQLVQIGVEGDGQQGTIEGGELVSGYTDANGQLSAIFTSGVEIGKIGVRAELLVDEGTGVFVSDHDRKVMYIGITLMPLPFVMR